MPKPGVKLEFRDRIVKGHKIPQMYALSLESGEYVVGAETNTISRRPIYVHLPPCNATNEQSFATGGCECLAKYLVSEYRKAIKGTMLGGEINEEADVERLRERMEEGLDMVVAHVRSRLSPNNPMYKSVWKLAEEFVLSRRGEMSFSISFTEPLDKVAERVASEHAPECVKEFVRKAIEHLTCPRVTVYGYGHICDSDGSYKISSCNLTITPLDENGKPLT